MKLTHAYDFYHSLQVLKRIDIEKFNLKRSHQTYFVTLCENPFPERFPKGSILIVEKNRQPKQGNFSLALCEGEFIVRQTTSAGLSTLIEGGNLIHRYPRNRLLDIGLLRFQLTTRRNRILGCNIWRTFFYFFYSDWCNGKVLYIPSHTMS